MIEEERNNLMHEKETNLLKIRSTLIQGEKMNQNIYTKLKKMKPLLKKTLLLNKIGSIEQERE